LAARKLLCKFVGPFEASSSSGVGTTGALD
jgi:hypothetical protein